MTLEKVQTLSSTQVLPSLFFAISSFVLQNRPNIISFRCYFVSIQCHALPNVDCVNKKAAVSVQSQWFCFQLWFTYIRAQSRKLGRRAGADSLWLLPDVAANEAECAEHLKTAGVFWYFPASVSCLCVIQPRDVVFLSWMWLFVCLVFAHWRELYPAVVAFSTWISCFSSPPRPCVICQYFPNLRKARKQMQCFQMTRKWWSEHIQPRFGSQSEFFVLPR